MSKNALAMLSLITMLMSPLSQAVDDSGISLDAHLHVFFEKPVEETDGKIQQFFERRKADRALLLSPSYTVDSGYGMANKGDDRRYRKVYNDMTAEMVRRFPDRLRGLCGISLQWEDASEVAKDCLQHDEMVGIKLRPATERLQDPVIFTRLKQLLADNILEMKIVLIHLGGDFPDAYGNPNFYTEEEREAKFESNWKELAAVTDLAGQFSRVEFVLAHSLSAPDLVMELAEKKKAKGLENLWLEVSTSLSLSTYDPYSKMGNGPSKNWELFAKAWRQFGVDKIIFGSDQFFGSHNSQPTTWEKEVGSIRNNPYLSIGEKDYILEYNGEAFWEKICSSCMPQDLEAKRLFRHFSESRNFRGSLMVDYSGPCQPTSDYVCAGNSTGSLPLAAIMMDQKYYESIHSEMQGYLHEWMTDASITEDKTEYLVRQFVEAHQLQSKLQKWHDVLDLVVSDAKELVRRQSDLSEEAVDDLFNENDVFVQSDFFETPEMLFVPTAYVGTPIRVGGVLVDRLTHFSSIYFLLAHEVGHQLEALARQAFPKALSCIEDKYSHLQFLEGVSVSQSEIWADLVAREMLALRMEKLNWTPNEKAYSVRNSGRFFCGYLGSAQGHPSGAWRIESLLKQPELNQMLCSGPAVSEATGSNKSQMGNDCKL